MSEMIVTLDQLRAAREFAEKVTPLRLRLYQNRRKDSPAPRELDPSHPRHDGVRNKKVLYPTDFPPETRR